VIVKLPLDEATEALDEWVGWARGCRTVVKLQKSIVKHRTAPHRTAIFASIEHGLSNGRVEWTP
jgi:transposase